MDKFTPEQRANIKNTREKLGHVSPLARRVAFRTSEILALTNEIESIDEKEFPLAKMLLIDKRQEAQIDLDGARAELKGKGPCSSE